MPSGYKLSKIYVGTDQVRPKTWKPGPNTLFYYPLHSDTTDVVGNYPWASGAATFSNNMATITTQLKRSGSAFQGYTGDFTISAYVKMTTSPNYACIGFKSDGNYDGSLCISSRYCNASNGANKGVGVSYYSSGWKYYSLVGTNGGVYNVIGVKSNGTMYVYVNGSLVGNYTAPNSPGYMGASGDTMTILAGVICADVFAENVAWTQQQVSDYYNLTKGIYGL